MLFSAIGWASSGGRESLQPQVVKLRSSTSNFTGTLVSPDGNVVLTCAHGMTKEKEEVEVETLNGQKRKATCEWMPSYPKQKSDDLALCKIENPITDISSACLSNRALREEDKVTTWGYGRWSRPDGMIQSADGKQRSSVGLAYELPTDDSTFPGNFNILDIGQGIPMPGDSGGPVGFLRDGVVFLSGLLSQGPKPEMRYVPEKEVFPDAPKRPKGEELEIEMGFHPKGGSAIALSLEHSPFLKFMREYARANRVRICGLKSGAEGKPHRRLTGLQLRATETASGFVH